LPPGGELGGPVDQVRSSWGGRLAFWGQDAPLAVQQLLRKKIKYVFVIFNENHSFDKEYGSATEANQAKGKQYANLVMSHIDCNTTSCLSFRSPSASRRQ
jgi:hypothetical protein